jgi:Na+/proline symporter
MWAAPVLLPGLADPTQAYVLLTQKYLPAGLVGLVVASMFAATMAMTTSDTNTISSVITRDILPTISARFRGLDQRQTLRIARWTTLGFTLLTLIVGVEAERFGGVLGLILTWFAALIGPVSVPLLLGLVPVFRHADARAAIGSIVAGFTAFVIVAQVMTTNAATRMSAPIAASLVVFWAMAWLNRKRAVAPQVETLLASLASGATGPRGGISK